MPIPSTRHTPHHERKRVAALRAYSILDTPREAVFDDLARLAASVCSATTAAIVFVDDERVWCKASVGGEDDSTGFAASLAAAVVEAGDPDVLIQTEPPGAAAPLVTHEGLIVGALCVSGCSPLDDSQTSALKAVARQVVTTLELRRHTAELLRLVGELDDARETIRYLALYDELTGLPRHHLFEDRLERSLAGARRRDTCVAVICLKIDDFPAFCDECGYDAGNALLRDLAHDLAGTLRATDTVARVGRDEFAILCDSLRRPEDAGVIGESLLAVCRREAGNREQRRRVSASIGIAVGPLDGGDAQGLLESAVAALEVRRAAGGDGWTLDTDAEESAPIPA